MDTAQIDLKCLKTAKHNLQLPNYEKAKIASRMWLVLVPIFLLVKRVQKAIS